MTKKEKLWETFQANRRALLANDIEALKEIYAEDYRGFNMRGEVETRDLIFEVYAPGMAKLDAFETENVIVEVLGDAGIIAGRGFVKGRFQQHPFEHHLHFMDVFVWRDDRWRYYLSHSTEIPGHERRD